eukprot:COSAG06_NODE_37499_length_434_cov_1.334328_1_plen_144_part_11
MHIINNDIGFAGLQHMAVTGSAEAEQYEDLLAASLDSESFVTWDFLPGAPHSCAPALWPLPRSASADGFCLCARLPACSVQRPAPQDRGGYTDSRGRYIAPFSRAGDGIPCDGYYSGEHNARVTEIFGALYDEMARREAWSDSR